MYLKISKFVADKMPKKCHIFFIRKLVLELGGYYNQKEVVLSDTIMPPDWATGIYKIETDGQLTCVASNWGTSD